jgi:hypothetical protein
MTGILLRFRLALVATIVVMLAALGACAPRTPEISRDVLGLDASGRPVVSFTECDRYGLLGNLGGCFRETPPVVWCYRTLGDNDCYRVPDQFATSEPEPVVDLPVLPVLYALPSPPPAAAISPVSPPDTAAPAQPGDPNAAP